MEKTTPFMIASKMNQILKNKFNQEGERLVHWNYKCDWKKLSVTHSVMFDSLRPCGREPARLLHLWDFPGKNTGIGCHFLLQGIFLTKGSNSGLPHLQADSLLAEPPGKPLEKIQTSGNTPHVHGLTWRHQYYPKWSMESMQSLSKSQWWFWRNRKTHPKIHMESPGALNSQNNLEKDGQSWKTHLFWFQNLLPSYN